ncbi:hypothetical protein [Gottfriedia acidiceleris]|uniref:hypothetical protein n=1 Tax=Gottfriedia acidiceleris TaxID=371036 RepID=UPI002FFEA335
MEKFCGRCAKDMSMTKEERLELAKSRISNQVYICPNCNEEHVYVSAVKVAIPLKENIEIKKNAPKKKSKVEQFSLF